MVQCTREPGLRTNNTEKGEKHLLMGIGILEIILMITSTDKEFMNGKLYIYIYCIYIYIYILLFSADGSKYEGAWVKDKQHGKGRKTFANGDRYTGDYIDDNKHGQGIYEW